MTDEENSGRVDVGIGSLARICDNRDRWRNGRGTLNYIDSSVVLKAIGSIVSGRVIGLGRTMGIDVEEDQKGSYRLEVFEHGDDSLIDTLWIQTHGFGLTHVDALNHSLLNGEDFGGTQTSLSDEPSTSGTIPTDVSSYRDGVVTRGVLLDIARARGAAYLDRGEEVSAADLEVAEQLSGAEVRRGDAVVVRTGLWARRALCGFDGDEVRAGLSNSAILWLHTREVAVFAGDCIERLPADNPEVPMPLHQVGHARMGLCILDNPDVERLRQVCDVEGRSEFVLVFAPPPIQGATGALVNPVVVF